EPRARAASLAAGVDRAELPDHVVRADREPGRVVRALHLRRPADRAERVDAAARPDRGAPDDDDVRAEDHARAELDLRADRAVGADLDVVGELRPRIDHRAPVDARHAAPPASPEPRPGPAA